FNSAGPPALLDGVKSVIENIQKDLFELVRIGNHNGKILGQALKNLDIAVGHSVGPQLESLPEHGVNLNELALRRHFPGEAQHILNNQAGSFRFLQDDTKIFPGEFRGFRILQQKVGKTDDP